MLKNKLNIENQYELDRKKGIDASQAIEGYSVYCAEVL